MQTSPDFLELDDRRLAYRRVPGTAPGIVFLSGLRSDMEGAKALHLERHCAAIGRGFTRFDYRGHGSSSGRFEEGCVGDWRDDALAILDAVTAGPVVLVGSSLGGWLALLAALARPRVRGLVGIAAAPDFTADLMRARLSAEASAILVRDGMLLAPSAYGEALPITRRLLEEGERHLLLRGPIELPIPVHLLHGQEDKDVPWATAIRLAGRLTSQAVTVELVKDGDHRLSREEDLRRIAAAVDRVVEQVG